MEVIRIFYFRMMRMSSQITECNLLLKCKLKVDENVTGKIKHGRASSTIDRRLTIECRKGNTDNKENRKVNTSCCLQS